MRTHLRIVGVLLIVLGALFAATGLVAWLLLAGIGLVSGEGAALAILGWIGAIAAGTLLVLGLPGIVVGRRLYAGESSARVPAIVLAILLALTGGAGVLVAAYMLWVLSDTEARTLLGDPPRRDLAVA
ncbi:MAG: hypothetical protein KDB94_10360 [Acidobacteria bacterium]|nr:hypothetical protein [Acidobacteriota bacterium]